MCRASLIFGAVLLSGCSAGSGPPVELIVPKGFTGTVWLILDPDAREIPLVDGRYRVVVPPDGVLRVPSHGPFEQWHSFSARYDDGTPIPSSYDGDAGVGSVAVAVRGNWAGVSHRGGREYQYHKYFVGTAKQRSELPDVESIPSVDK
jgi:hypothetical protein